MQTFLPPLWKDTEEHGYLTIRPEALTTSALKNVPVTQHLEQTFYPSYPQSGDNLNFIELYNVSTDRDDSIAGTYPGGSSTQTTAFREGLEARNTAMSNLQLHAFLPSPTEGSLIPSNGMPPAGNMPRVSNLSPVKIQPTSVLESDDSKSHVHHLIDLHKALPEEVCQLVTRAPVTGHRCALSNCTSPFKVFPSEAAVIEHIRLEDAPEAKSRFWCSCNKWFASKQNGMRHEKCFNEGNKYVCSSCQKGFKRKDGLLTHKKAKHPI